MPQRVYAVTVNVTRTIVVDTETELDYTALGGPHPACADSPVVQADWEKLEAAVHRGASAFLDDICENISVVEIDHEMEEFESECQKSDDPLETA